MFQTFGLFFYNQLISICNISLYNSKIVIEEINENCNNDVKIINESGFDTRIVKMPISRDEVNRLILSDKVVIFSKSYCPYCKMTKDVFDTIKQKYTVIELDHRDDTYDFQNILKEITGARTVPRVFLKGEFIGGGTDIKRLHKSGELATLIK